jgi:hypothetical protein
LFQPTQEQVEPGLDSLVVASTLWVLDQLDGMLVPVKPQRRTG